MTTRFSRQSFLGQDSERILKALSVGVVGLGGGGSHIVQQLAHIGVGNFILFDDDRIEETNINRLVGATMDDVNRKEWKLSIAKRLIVGVNPTASVAGARKKWQQAPNLLYECDVIFGCVDSFAARNDLERFARRLHTPYIDIGMDVHADAARFSVTGQVAVSMPGRACLHCMGILTPQRLNQEAQQYGMAGGNPQVIWPNGALASTAVGLMVQLFTPWDKKKWPAALLEYDGNEHAITASSALIFLEGVACPHFLKADDLGDPWFAWSGRKSPVMEIN